MNVVSANSQVTLHFALLLDDGGVVDSTFEGKPATLVIGDGNLLASFESTLLGLAAGDEREFVMPPEKAFGMPNPNNVQYFKRSDFAFPKPDGNLDGHRNAVVGQHEPL